MPRICHCGASLEGRHGNVRYCSDECRPVYKDLRVSRDRTRDWSYKKNGQCSRCGSPVMRSKSSRAEIICHPCRRAIGPPPPPVAVRACAHCSNSFTRLRSRATVYCSLSCAGAATHQGPTGSRRGPSAQRRVDRENAAPGLSANKRRSLLHTWRRRGKLCIYCAGGCETVDHLIPLSRGGTNYEGNLAPCCRRCNSSKCDRLVIEHRWSTRAASSVSMVAVWMPRAS